MACTCDVHAHAMHLLLGLRPYLLWLYLLWLYVLWLYVPWQVMAERLTAHHEVLCEATPPLAARLEAQQARCLVITP